MEDQEDKLRFFEENYPDVAEGTAEMIRVAFDMNRKAQQFYEILGKEFPTWQTIWKSDAFQEFLKQPREDSYLRYDNYFYVKSAFDRLDIDYILHVFKEFSKKSKPRPSEQTISVQEARRRLKELTNLKSSGGWKGKEKKFEDEFNALTKLIIDAEKRG